ncbi:reverse transcriptase domain-containing protein [Tanacetum coccineum]
MAAHTERMERFKKAIFKQREEINDRMVEMFGLLRELTTSGTLEKVLVREEASNPIANYVYAISLVNMKKDKSIKNNEVVNKNVVESSELDVVEPIKLVDKKKKMDHGLDDESVRSMKEELTGWETKADVLVKMPRLTNEKLVGTDIRLSLASHSYIYPLGLAKDVLIDIAGYVYPLDFVILDIEEDKNRPFILETPFLITTKAEIRFDKGTITLKASKNKINFFKIICPLERIKNHQEKEIGFNKWRSKVFDDEYLTSKKENSDVIFDKEKPESS